MKKILTAVFCDEEGAITVDWVVLTAAITGLAAICYALIQNGSEEFSEEVETALTDVTVAISSGGENPTPGGIVSNGQDN